MSTVRETELRHTIALQAANWYLRHREGELNDAERDAFLQWLTASPLNTQEYLAQAQLWGRLKEAVPDLKWDTAALKREAQTEAGNVIAFKPAPRTPARYLKSRVSRIGAVAATLLIAAGVFYQFAPGWMTGKAQVFAAAADKPRMVTLDDGSVLRLNLNSRVEVRYSTNGRNLSLIQGQAYFGVVPDPGRPFRVQVDDTEVTAIGTAFDVARRDPQRVTVTVVEGLVAVEDWKVQAGQQLRVGSNDPGPASVNVREATAWMRREVSFAGSAVAEVVREFNRYLDTPIRIEDAELNALKVGGVFDTYDADAFLDFLRQYDVEVSQRRGAIQVEPRRH